MRTPWRTPARLSWPPVDSQGLLRLPDRHDTNHRLLPVNPTRETHACDEPRTAGRIVTNPAGRPVPNGPRRVRFEPT